MSERSSFTVLPVTVSHTAEQGSPHVKYYYFYCQITGCELVKRISNSRRGVDEVSERRESLEHPVGDDLHVAIPHAPEVVEGEEVHVDQAYGPGSHQERPC